MTDHERQRLLLYFRNLAKQAAILDHQAKFIHEMLGLCGIHVPMPVWPRDFLEDDAK